MSMVISQLGLKQETLKGETIIVTGAGGGIGYEAARAFLWLGANVVIAEIDPKGAQATERLNAELPRCAACPLAFSPASQ